MGSNRYPLHLIELDLVAGAVVERLQDWSETTFMFSNPMDGASIDNG